MNEKPKARHHPDNRPKEQEPYSVNKGYRDLAGTIMAQLSVRGDAT